MSSRDRGGGVVYRYTQGRDSDSRDRGGDDLRGPKVEDTLTSTYI